MINNLQDASKLCLQKLNESLTKETISTQAKSETWMLSTKSSLQELIWSWGTRAMAMAGEVTRHGRAHPYSWSVSLVSLRSKESEGGATEVGKNQTPEPCSS
jgi:hypothetical protein